MGILLRNALVLLLLLTAITGFAYPVVVGGVGHLLFSHEAGGSLIVEDGKVRGSALIGQHFSAPGYFWGRPSATTPDPYLSLIHISEPTRPSHISRMPSSA